MTKVQRFFFASTSAVYENSTLKPFTEDIQVIPDLIYSQSKLSSEHICHSFRENYGIDVVIGRFFNVYGPHQDFRRPNPPFTSYLIREIMHNRIPTLFNDGEYKRDYIYIDDLTRLVLGLLHKPNLKYLTYNLTSGDAFSPRQIVNLLRGILGVDINSQYASE